MSWFTQSITNTFKLHYNDEKQYNLNNNNNTNDSTNQNDEQQVKHDNSLQSPRTGVKEDLSEITKTLSRQFWGVASLITPPDDSNDRSKLSDPEAIAGIRRDFAEIGDRFRSEISKLSNNVDVLGITKLASDLLQIESDDDDYDSIDSDDDGDGVVGVTDEVVVFACDIAMHPETWLYFPLHEDEDFDLSDVQREHALAVERLAPRLRALRIELCPGYMSESSFWKIYFVLLHPRLECDAAERLSTANIVKARALLTHELKNRCYSENMSDSKSKSLPLEVSVIETVKYPIKGDVIQIVDKSVIQEESCDGKDEDDWLKEESSEVVTNRVAIPIENNEDVSFSDLEDDDGDDNGNIPIHFKKATYAYDSTTKDTRDWVTDSGKNSDSLGQVSVHNSETKECNDWLDVHIDVA